jgi:hypothetical protein
VPSRRSGVSVVVSHVIAAVTPQPSPPPSKPPRVRTQLYQPPRRHHLQPRGSVRVDMRQYREHEVRRHGARLPPPAISNSPSQTRHLPTPSLGRRSAPSLAGLGVPPTTARPNGREISGPRPGLTTPPAVVGAAHNLRRRPCAPLSPRASSHALCPRRVPFPPSSDPPPESLSECAPPGASVRA